MTASVWVVERLVRGQWSARVFAVTRSAGRYALAESRALLPTWTHRLTRYVSTRAEGGKSRGK